MLTFPVDMTYNGFSLLARAPQMVVVDAKGTMLFVRQRGLWLHPRINIFSDEAQSTVVYTITGDRPLRFRPKYNFSDAQGRQFGSIGRKKVLLNDNYIVDMGTQARFDIDMDRRPPDYYVVSRTTGADVIRIPRKSMWLERRLILEQLADLDDTEKECALLAMIVILFERAER